MTVPVGSNLTGNVSSVGGGGASNQSGSNIVGTIINLPAGERGWSTPQVLVVSGLACMVGLFASPYVLPVIATKVGLVVPMTFLKTLATKTAMSKLMIASAL